jgi:hypothetical protein
MALKAVVEPRYTQPMRMEMKIVAMVWDWLA